jgi:hypothetical protein
MDQLGIFGFLSYLNESQIKRITLEETNLAIERVNVYLQRIGETKDSLEKIELTNIVQAITDNIIDNDF